MVEHDFRVRSKVTGEKITKPLVFGRLLLRDQVCSKSRCQARSRGASSGASCSDRHRLRRHGTGPLGASTTATGATTGRVVGEFRAA